MKKIILSTIAVISLSSALLATTTEDTSSINESSIFDRVHFKGDLRLRDEMIERDDYKTVPGDKDKHRQRFRLRLYTNFDITDKITFETAILTGKKNPTSGNETFRSEPLPNYIYDTLKVNILDISYKFDNSTVKVGKSAYMLYRPIKSQLIWDNDLRFEGINYNYKDASRMITLGVNQIRRYTSEDQSSGEINFFVGQYVQTIKLDNSKLNIGAGLTYYDGVKGNTSPYLKGELGNTIDANDLYTNDYTILDGFAELKLKNVFGKAFKIAGSVAYNSAASNNNFGYLIGLQIGDTKKDGEWKVAYSYSDIQEDAVFSGHNDSDNNGGGSAASGHAFRLKYRVSNHLDIGGQFFFNKLYASRSATTGMEPDYTRTQMDVIIKF